MFDASLKRLFVTETKNHGSRTYRSKLFIHPCFTLRLCPLPYWWPTPSVTQPPIASITSAGHSTSLSRSLRLCRNEWITQPCGTLGFSHLLIAAEAELALLDEPRLYLGNRNFLPVAPSKALEAAHRAFPTRGTHLWLPLVLSRLQACGEIFT